MRQAEQHRLRNRPVRSAVRTYYKKAGEAVAAGESDAREAVIAAVRALDKAAQKKVIHPNAAARRKSRLMKKLNAANGGA